MTQPPRTPMTPRAPMAPLRPMTPLAPMTPLLPGQRRQPVQQAQPEAAAPPGDATPVYEPPPIYEPVSMYQYQPVVTYSPPPVTPSPQVVNLGLSQAPTAGWGGGKVPRIPVSVRRSSGGNKAGLVIGLVVAGIVALAAIGSVSSSGSGQVVSAPSISVSIPPLTGGVGATSGTAPTVPHPGKPTHAGAAKPARRSGRTLTLTGSSPGQRIRVTFARWVDNAVSKDSIFGPSSGKRYVAAQFRITNTGAATYTDSPSNGARVVDSKGHKYRTSFFVDGIRQGEVFGAVVSLHTGRSAVGYLVFEVPKRAKIRHVQFSENSGFGQTGQWTFAG